MNKFDELTPFGQSKVRDAINAFRELGAWSGFQEAFLEKVTYCGPIQVLCAGHTEELEERFDADVMQDFQYKPTPAPPT